MSYLLIVFGAILVYPAFYVLQGIRREYQAAGRRPNHQSLDQLKADGPATTPRGTPDVRFYRRAR